ncbi:MAG: hypothetical protein R6U89_04805 [Dehalococcoidia bacterium]
MLNLAVAVPMLALGIRHSIHGGGWKTGVIELALAFLLIVAAVIIRRAGGRQNTFSQQ